jgi:hypothetical protein
VRSYESEWFYVQNLEECAPEWTNGAKKRFRPKIDFMLDAIAKKRSMGLIRERLIHSFMKCCLQLLATR